MKILKFTEGKYFDIEGEKPKLECEVETIYRVSYDALEEFVKEVYGGDFDFVANGEYSNDSSHEFDVSDDTEDLFLDEEELAKARSGDLDDFGNDDILQLLCVDGYIDPGTYIVQVCW